MQSRETPVTKINKSRSRTSIFEKKKKKKKSYASRDGYFFGDEKAQGRLVSARLGIIEAVFLASESSRWRTCTKCHTDGLLATAKRNACVAAIAIDDKTSERRRVN